MTTRKNTKIKSRRREVYADCGDVWVRVEISVNMRGNALSVDEHKLALDDLTSRVMQDIPATRYINVPLSRLKVSR